MKSRNRASRNRDGTPFKRTHTMERLPMTPLEKLGDALETCIVACQGRRNSERAQAVLDVIREQGWAIVPPEVLAFYRRGHPGDWTPTDVADAVLDNNDIGVSLTKAILALVDIARAALLPPEEEK